MTLNEAIECIKEVKEDYWEDDGYGYATADCQRITTALDEVIERLEQAKWIPVSERLPEEYTFSDGFIDPSEYVLVQMKSGYMKVSRYWGSRERYSDRPWIDLSYPTTDEVIAWMPLPPCYEPQKSEDKE